MEIKHNLFVTTGSLSMNYGVPHTEAGEQGHSPGAVQNGGRQTGAEATCADQTDQIHPVSHHQWCH